MSRFADGILRSATSPTWAPQAVAALDQVLADHAHCEKKAAASAVALINDYPDDSPLVSALGHLAEEEIGHFREVHARLVERGVKLGRDPGDPYARGLLALVRQPQALRKLDRLLVCALIEARSCERFRLLREALAEAGEGELARWFQKLESSEAGHATLFVRLAEEHAGVTATEQRLEELATAEAALVASLPELPRIH